MTTRRQLIQSIPALPLMTTAGATALLVACGKKEQAGSVSSAPATASPSPAPVPAPAVSTDASTATGAATGNTGSAGSPGNSGGTASVASGPLLEEKDAQAIALGYVTVAGKADKVKFPKYEQGQACSNCSLYLGGTAEQGGCPLFPGKQVLSKAWCSAWVKKVA